MKKIFLLLPLLLAIVSVTGFSRANNNVDPRTEKVFKTEFAGAANAIWAKEGNFLKVTFTWASHQAVAYFNTDAELVGCMRGLFFSQLPLTVIRSVERNFQNAVIIETREITNDEGISYKLIVEYKNKKHRIRLNSFGDILENEKLKD